MAQLPLTRNTSLSGSVRREGRRVRLIVLLADAAQGRQLWSGRVDAEGDTPFALQDRLCQQVVSKLATAVRMAEFSRAGRLMQPVEALSPYDLYLRAQAICRRGSAGNEAALKLLRRAADLDPELGVAHALTARCLHLQRLMGWTHPEEPALYDAVRQAHRAVEIDADDPQILWMAGLALANIGGNVADGRHLMDRSLAINPSDASAWIASCFVHAHSGEFDAAMAHFQRAQEVNADDSSQHVQWHAAATAYFVAGRHEEADAATDRALAQQPGYPGSLRLKDRDLGAARQGRRRRACGAQAVRGQPRCQHRKRPQLLAIVDPLHRARGRGHAGWLASRRYARGLSIPGTFSCRHKRDPRGRPEELAFAGV